MGLRTVDYGHIGLATDVQINVNTSQGGTRREVTHHNTSSMSTAIMPLPPPTSLAPSACIVAVSSSGIVDMMAKARAQSANRLRV